MKKILNLTRNEMADVESEETVNFDPPIKNEFVTIFEKTKYKIKDKPQWWKDEDNYKIIEIK